MTYKSIPKNIFEVCYWDGGTEVGKWRRTVPRFAGRWVAATSDISLGLVRAGYRVKVFNTRAVERHGLPETLE